MNLYRSSAAILICFLSLLVVAHTFILLYDNFGKINAKKTTMSMTDIEFYSAFAEAYIAVLGSNAHWHVLAFVSFTFGCSGIRTGKKNWWGKLFPITFLLIAFLVATSVFLLAEEYISFLTESQHAQLLSKIVALKCSTILIGIISGGLLYDQLKSWIEPENT